MITIGRVQIRLTGAHVDHDGFPTRAAELLVWSRIAGLPHAVWVIIDLGPTRHVNHRIVHLCREHLGPDQKLIIEGRPEAVVASSSLPEMWASMNAFDGGEAEGVPTRRARITWANLIDPEP